MKNTKLKIAVLATNGLVMGAGVTTPVLADIMKAFPTVDPTTIMLISGLPSLFILLFSPLYGKLAQTFPKRNLYFFAAACFLVGGLVPAFMTSIIPILAMRALLGVGLGFIQPMVSDLVTDFFDGHDRETMMGLQGATASIGGIIYQLLGGYLGSIQWNYCFYAYLLGVLVVLFVFFTLPEPEKKSMPAGEKAKMPLKVFGTLIGLLVYQLAFFALINNAAVMLVGENIADAAAIGLAFTVMTVGSLAGGFIAGKIMQIFKGYALGVTFVFSIIGFGIAYVSYTLPMFIAACAIIGLGLGLTIPTCWVRISLTVPGPLVPMGISLGVSLMNLGSFIQPYVYAPINSILGLQIGRPAFAIATVISILLTVVFLGSGAKASRAMTEAV